MPRIASWSEMPAGVRAHLAERMRDRNISLDDLNRLRLWIESQPEVPGASGTKTLGLSNSAAKANSPRRFSWQAKRRQAKNYNPSRVGLGG